MFYFGGKSKVASEVWDRFGNVPNYIESFFGSGAILLNRPHEAGIETVNDKNGFLSNFWRAVKHDPEQVAAYADWPASENDLHARHSWLVRNGSDLAERLEGDPEYYDAKVAGWWCWGMCVWIGGGFCSGKGPWVVVEGKLVHGESGNAQGISRRRIHLSSAGQGISRQRPHLKGGVGIQRQNIDIRSWMHVLSTRFRCVRVACGDWKRVMGPCVTIQNGVTGVFLDPPYGSDTGRHKDLYTTESMTVARECRGWCIENGRNKLLRIALCGYTGEHDELSSHGWTPYFWETQGGYANQGNGIGRANAKREVIWFSPHCLSGGQMRLF